MSENCSQEERPELSEKLSELEILRQSLDDAKQKERAVYEQLLRLGAEFDNYRKRSEQRFIEARRAGQEDVLAELFNLGDALIHAVSAAQKSTDLESLKKGLSLVLAQFEKLIKDHGVEPIKAIGERMDPHKHEALFQEHQENVEDGVILDEIQRGYSCRGRVIRTSKVKVAAKPTVEPGQVVQ